MTFFTNLCYYNFEDLQFSALCDEINLYNYLKSKITDSQKYYLFFDEIQNIEKADDDALMDYIRWDGMPQRFSIQNEEERRIFLSDLYDSIVLKDIISRYKVQNVDLLNRIVTYLSVNMSQIFSGTSIVNFLKSENRECSKETLYNYLSYITNSCVMNKARRYDIHGKKLL